MQSALDFSSGRDVVAVVENGDPGQRILVVEEQIIIVCLNVECLKHAVKFFVICRAKQSVPVSLSCLRVRVGDGPGISSLIVEVLSREREGALASKIPALLPEHRMAQKIRVR